MRHAIELMVFHGHTRDEAAKEAGFALKSLYNALRRPQVKRLYLDELEVLRTSERARNIHTLVEVRDQKSNQMARVTAVKALEQIDDAVQGVAGRLSSPGVTIVIQAAPSHTPDIRTIEAKPLIEHASRSSSEHDDGE